MAIFTPVRRWQPAFRPFKREKASRLFIAATERLIKGPLFGCRMCGNCLLQETAFICPMECPKGLRNGPCGGSLPGKCYIDETRKCVWHEIYSRSVRMKREAKLLEVLPPLDWDKAGTETWGEVAAAMRRAGVLKVIHGLAVKESRNRNIPEGLFRKIRQPIWWSGDDRYHPPGYKGSISELERRLKSGEFVFTTELIPPIHSGTEKLEKNIESVKPFVAAVNFTDNSSSVPRMSGYVCCTVSSKLGCEPVLQITARDNNRFALQSKALGANSSGIKNVLCITGDSPATGPSPRGPMQIYDLDAIQMLWILRKMRDEGRYLDGREIKQPPELFLGAAASPFASTPALVAIREEKKINAGAQFLQTNLAYDINRLEEWLGELDKRNILEKVFILIGIAPIRSMRMAEHLKYEVAGVSIPDNILKRIEKAGDSAAAAGTEISIEFIEKVRKLSGVNGVHLMTMGCEDTVKRIVSEFSNK